MIVDRKRSDRREERAELTLDEKSNGFRLSNVLDEGVLLLSESVLVNESSVSKNIGSELVDRVLSDSSTAELKPGSQASQNEKNEGQLSALLSLFHLLFDLPNRPAEKGG